MKCIETPKPRLFFLMHVLYPFSILIDFDLLEGNPDLSPWEWDHFASNRDVMLCNQPAFRNVFYLYQTVD